MLVMQILKAKGGQKVLTLPPTARVGEAVSVLAQHRIGALVISPNGHEAVGILSERDIVRELADRGPSLLTEKVEQIMTRRLVTCNPVDTVRSVVERMTVGRFRHMPVLQDGVMVGLISIGDVVKWRLDELTTERAALESMIRGH